MSKGNSNFGEKGKKSVMIQVTNLEKHAEKAMATALLAI